MESCDNDIDDIEDIVKVGDLKPSDRYNNKTNVTLRARKRNIQINGNEEIEVNENEKLHQSVSLIDKSN